MALKEITRKVVSYCEIPQDITEKDYSVNEASCDSYIEIEVTSREEQKKFDDDFDMINWIINEYPELEGETILIHIDY